MALGWGIIGPGRIANQGLAPAINRAPDSFLRAVVSRDQGRAEAFAQQHNAALATTSYEQMLADPEVQVVYIGTPNAQHPEQAIAAFQAGKHVLCDKPLALNTADAQRMVDAARQHGRKFGTGFQSRHFAALQEARRLIESGALGDLLLLQVESANPSTPVSWRADRELAGAEVLFNIGVHPNDFIRYLVGAEISEVVAMNDATSEHWMDLMDLMLFRFENGVMAYVNANQKVPHPQPDLSIYGTQGRIVGRNVTRAFLDGELRVTLGDQETVTQVTSKDAFERMVQAFNRAVIEDREPNASGLDGLRSVQIAEAVLKSAREGVRVKLTY